MTFKNRLECMQLGEIITKSVLVNHCDTSFLTKMKMKLSSSTTGSIRMAGLTGKVETKTSIDFIKSGVIVSLHIVKIKA